MNKLPKQLKRREFLTTTTQTAAAACAAAGSIDWLAAESSAAEKQRSLPIQIGILLGTFRSGSLEARLDAAKAAGIDSVQLSMDCAGLPMMPDEISPDLAGQIRRAASARGIKIASVAGTFNMCHPDAEHRQGGDAEQPVQVPA